MASRRSNIFSRKVGCFNNLTVRSTQDKLVSVQAKSTLRVKVTIFFVKLCARISRLHFGIQFIFFKVTNTETWIKDILNVLSSRSESKHFLDRYALVLYTFKFGTIASMYFLYHQGLLTPNYFDSKITRAKASLKLLSSNYSYLA